VTVPVPVPLAPAVTVMNPALLDAVQLQVVPVVTVTLDDPPLAAMDAVVDDSVNVQGPEVLKRSTFEYSLVVVPSVARARQNHRTLGPRSRLSVQLVVPLPCATPSCVNVRTGSDGKESRSETSKRYVTVPTLPVAVALLTTSVGLPGSTISSPIGDLAVGADNVPAAGGGGGGGVEPARCVTVALVPAIVSAAVRSAPVFAATVN